MSILQELEAFIKEFNTNNDEDFRIDSIRIEFSKQYKLEQLQELGDWQKIQSNSNILYKLKKRLTDNEITSAFRLNKENIYYFNSSEDKPKYRKATLVMFGMHQHHKPPPPRELISRTLSILKDVTNIDICLDMKQKPNLERLKHIFYLNRYITTDGVPTDTYYINDAFNEMIEKITIYNKAFKNNLKGILWRIEAKILIPNHKCLALPLNEFKTIIDIAKGIR